MKKAVKVLFLVVLLGVLGPILWLTMTQSGLRWLVDTAKNSYSSFLTIENVTGSLAGKIAADRLVVNSAGYKIVLDNVEIATQLRKLIFGQLYVRSLAIKSISVTPPEKKHPQTTPPANPIAFNIVLPLSININSATIGTLAYNEKLSNLPSTAHVELTGLHIRKNVSIGNLSVTSSMGKLQFKGTLPLSSSGNLSVDLRSNLNIATTQKPLVAALKATGTYSAVSVQCELTSPDTVYLRGQVTNILSTLQWNVSLDSPVVALAHWVNNAQYRLTGLKLKSSGQLSDFNLSTNGVLDGPAFNNLAFDVSANQSNNAWTIHQLNITNKKTNLEVALQGTIDTAYDFNVNTNANLSGKWKNFQWPLADKNPDMVSQLGTLEFSGSISHYDAKIAGDYSVASYHFSDINLTGNGDPTHIQFDSLKCTYLDGNWSGNGTVDWSTGVSWQATLAVNRANVKELLEGIESNLASDIVVSGSVINSQLSLDTRFRKLKGLINSHPVNGAVDIGYNNSELSIRHADLRSHDNHVNADVTLDFSKNASSILKNASWSITANNLNTLYPGLKGKLNSKGKFNFSNKISSLQGELAVSKLQYKTYSADQFSIKVAPLKDSHVKINARGSNIDIDNYPVSSISLTSRGPINNQTIELHASTPKYTRLAVKTSVAYKNTEWQVNVHTLRAHFPNFGDWGSSTQPKILATTTGFSAQPICVQKQDAKDTLCLSATADNYKNIAGLVSIKSLGLENFKELLPPNFDSVNGVLDGQAQIRVLDGNISLSSVKLQSTKGQFNVISDGTVKNQFEYSDLDLTLTNSNKLYVITSSTHIIDAGYVKSQISFPSAYLSNGDWQNNKLSGYLDVQFENLDKLSLILPVITNAKGHWSSHFTFSGTLSHPVLAGESSLEMSTVDLPISGITIKNLKFVTKSKEGNTLAISGSAQSGKGNISVAGTLKDYSLDKFNGAMKIDGDHFKIANLPEISAVVSPKLNFSLTDQKADLQGDLTIDEADIKILSQISSMSPSPDVVIVNQKKPKASPYPGIAFQSDVRVTLGDKVWLRGYGFQGRLNGTILVKQRPAELTKASGTINILDGTYSAYGQSLNIDKGILNFAGNPIDNPSINIRASRKSSNDVVAGLLITGQAQSPTIKLFSEPPMDDADILAYIILGYPLKQASNKDGAVLTRAAGSIGLLGGEKLVKRYAKYFGIDEVKVESNTTTQEASLVLGKYLSPQLYMSYAIGFGQAINTLQLQYKLSEHWVIKTESGIGQAADILFTIEK